GNQQGQGETCEGVFHKLDRESSHFKYAEVQRNTAQQRQRCFTYIPQKLIAASGLRQQRAYYLWLSPPSTASNWPVMKLEAVRKNTTASAISSGVPPRWAGVFLIISRPRASMSSKGMTPGATELTVMWGAQAL